MFYKICRAFALLYTRILFHVEVTGRENIPQKGGYILAANHRTNFDPILAVAGLRLQVYYMAKIELFQKSRLFGWILRKVGAFPIERGKGDTGAIGWAIDVIRRGGVLGMFPEGTRSKDGTPGRPKSGVALIAKQTGADILPCAVCFEEGVRFRAKLTVRYGKPIPNATLGFTAGVDSPHEIKTASRLIMGTIVELLEVGK